jgi:quercetin dioxygenase-like cupin family protein
MIVRSLQDMVGGWIVGNFEPTCLKSTACEVACKHYDAGAVEAAHVHRIATELTLIAAGRVTMNGCTYGAGDIIVLEPGEATDFRAIEKTTTVVVKMPSVMGDKYPVQAGGPQ